MLKNIGISIAFVTTLFAIIAAILGLIYLGEVIDRTHGGLWSSLFAMGCLWTVMVVVCTFIFSGQTKGNPK